MIAAWLSNITARDGITSGQKPGYELIFFEETTARDKPMAAAIRKALRLAYRDQTYVDARIAAGAFSAAEEVYQQEAFPSRSNVMKGDFGEILGDFLIGTVNHLQCEMPVKNVANKENVNLASRGFDYLGFRFEEVHGNDVLVIGEAKYRSKRVSNIFLAGQVTLKSYTREREIQEIGKLAHLLHREKKLDLMNKLARFGEGFSKADFEKSHVLVVLHDSTTSVEKAIKKIPARSGLKKFAVIDVAIADLDTLVSQAFSRV